MANAAGISDAVEDMGRDMDDYPEDWFSARFEDMEAHDMYGNCIRPALVDEVVPANH